MTPDHYRNAGQSRRRNEHQVGIEIEGVRDDGSSPAEMRCQQQPLIERIGQEQLSARWKFSDARQTFHEFSATREATQPNFEVTLGQGPCHSDKLTLGSASLQGVNHHEESGAKVVRAVSIVENAHVAFSAWAAALALASSGMIIWVLTPRASRKFRCHSSNTSKSQITPARLR